MDQRLLRNLRFRCPDCEIELAGIGTDSRQCLTCKRTWERTDGKWRFGGEAKVVSHEPTDSFKSGLKAYPRAYTFATNLVGPVYPYWYFEVRRLRRNITPGMVAVDVGSGNFRQNVNIVNVDLMPYPNVDVVTSADGLPFCDESVDIVSSIAVLEHVPDPYAVIGEIRRILKPSGTGYIYVPFIQGFHAAPHDYQRFTRPGLEHALRAFEIIRTESFGPTSGLIWVLAEWLSILLSFGSHHVQRALALTFMVLLSPMKYLDVALRHFPGGDTISTGFLCVVRKAEHASSPVDELRSKNESDR